MSPEPQTPRRISGWEVAKIARQLGHRDVRVQDRALKTLQEMGPDAADVIRRLIKRDLRIQRIRLWINVAVLTVLGLALLQRLRHGHVRMGDVVWVFYAAAAYVNMVFGIKVSRMHRNAASALRRLREPHVLAPLLEMSAISAFYPACSDALIGALNNVKSSDSDKVDDATRNLMRRALDSLKPELVEATLAAVGQLADPMFLPEVKRLAHDEGLGLKHPSIQTAAENCLSILEAAAEREEVSGRLLRPAGRPDGEGASLLRPTAAHSAEESSALLRPYT